MTRPGTSGTPSMLVGTSTSPLPAPEDGLSSPNTLPLCPRPVADASTGEFMQNLYRLRQEQKLTKAAALQKAQLVFIRSEQLAHPFYWGPFILMGNWL